MWHGVTVKTKPVGSVITVEKLKARLRVDHADEDVLLADLLKGAVARIDGPSGIGFAMMGQTWRKSLDCFPYCTILLPGAPVKSIAAVTYLDVNGDEQTVDPADYRLDVDAEPARLEPAFGKSWPASRFVKGAVKIDYVLGENDAADVPADLIDAVCLLVAHRYENREAVAEGAMSAVPLGFESIVREYQRGAVAA